MARTSGNDKGYSGKASSDESARGKRGKSGSSGSESRGRSKSGSSGTKMMLLVGLPALALGGFMAYQGNEQIRGSVDQGASNVQTWIHNETASDGATQPPDQNALAENPDPGAESEPESTAFADVPQTRFRTEASDDPPQLAPALLPQDDQASQADAKKAKRLEAKAKKEAAAKEEAKRNARKKDAASKGGANSMPTKQQMEEAAKLAKASNEALKPKVVPQADLPVRAGSITLRESQELASRLFGGEVLRSNVAKNRDWYEMTWKGGQKAAPFDVAPKVVTVYSRALTGRFAKNHNGFVVFLMVTDPQGPEWTHTYLGAALVAGTPEQPGRVIGTTAVQAPKGRFTRREARDLDGDGIAELVLEIESHSPGGYLQRDLAVHKFSRSGTSILFASRTLEDGPGVPTQEAKYKEVTFQDTNKDGIDEIVVKEGVRTFDVDETLYRTPTGQKLLSTRVFKLTKGRYRIATK